MNTRTRSYLMAAGFAGAALLGFCAQNVPAQIILTIDRQVNVRAAPGKTAKRVNGLASGQKVTLLSEQRRGSFFHVRLTDNTDGWVHGKYLILPDIPEPVGLETIGPEAATPSSFPACGPEHHYRWKQKISAAGFSQTPSTASVHAVLGWAPLPFGGHDILSWCQDRAPKEKKAYAVIGWVRRTRKEADGDVHIEITQGANDDVLTCMVAEIPPAGLSPRFNKARGDLATLLSVSQLTNKDFDTPTHIRFTGLAFWDGWHAGGALPVGHGRCNSTKGAAWELHGVFKVVAP